MTITLNRLTDTTLVLDTRIMLTDVRDWTLDLTRVLT